MARDLTASQIERQNVLNNTVALPRIQEELSVKALEFEGRYVLTKQMVADYYGVNIRTISRYIENNQEELEHNGYFLCKGKTLKDFKLRFVQDIDVPKNTPQIGLFDFRSFLNIGMLLTESEKAKYVRSRILDIVISTINEKTGGGTKYINRRDREYLPAAIQEDNYRKNLTDAINKYVDGHKTYKYAQITDMIYKVADKAAYLMFSLCRGHYFADCNKRISITLTLYFLVKNGYMYLAKTFMERMEAIGYHVAAGHIDRDLLTEVMRSIVDDEDYSESTKLDLIAAMSQGLGFSDE